METFVAILLITVSLILGYKVHLLEKSRKFMFAIMEISTLGRSMMAMEDAEKIEALIDEIDVLDLTDEERLSYDTTVMVYQIQKRILETKLATEIQKQIIDEKEGQD